MKHDLIIIGAGPAGLSAAIYAARYNLDTVVISKDWGGVASTAYKVCNFPSYDEISGLELMEKMLNQAKKLNVRIIFDEALSIKPDKNFYKITTKEKAYESKKIIYAGGTKRQRLNIPGENEFIGKGVSYCATCDAAFFKNKDAAIIGGSNGALTAALLLSKYANKVYLIYKGDMFTKAEPAWSKLVEKNAHIKKIFNDEIVKISGKNKVEKIILKSGKELNIDGVFIEIGSQPDNSLIKNIGIKTNKKGYIITDKNQRTNLKGFFAAGDITNNTLKQIVTAVSEGAVAVYNCYKEIHKDTITK